MQRFLQRIEELEEHFDAVDYCNCPSSGQLEAPARIWALLHPNDKDPPPMPKQLPVICTHRRHKPRPMKFKWYGKPEERKAEEIALCKKLLGDAYPEDWVYGHVGVTWEENIAALEAKTGDVELLPTPDLRESPERTARVKMLEDKIGKTWEEHKELHGIKDDRLPTGEGE